MSQTKELSAYQMLQRSKANLQQALQLLVSPSHDLNPQYLDAALIGAMKPEWPKDKALPLLFSQNQLYVACPEDIDAETVNKLKPLANNVEIKLLKINVRSWDFVIKGGGKGPQGASNGGKKIATLGADLAATLEKIPVRQINANDENSIGNEVRWVLTEAAKIGASDIHFEPYDKELIVRLRIDGVLRDICKYRCDATNDYRKIILARIKIIADLNIAESRVPQDGRVTENINGARIDLRVSTLPTLHGEKCVIRLLPHENSFLELSDLGMPFEIIPEFESWLRMSQGMVLITGPTGSGKTSTLYTSLAKLLDISKNVVTVEDPVEFQLARVNQVQVNVKAGLSFSAGLRSILRQDPDIIMIGEIRDLETAEIAVKAALTGHLVLSTLHTNDAPSTITRLIDMGVEPYLVSSALVGVIAQRLLRRACQYCKEEYTSTDEDMKTLKISSPVTLVKTKGCQNCNNTGYSGREGIFEMMPLTEEMKTVVQKGAGVDELKAAMTRLNMPTLFAAASYKVLEKKTTVEELLRVVPTTK
ncbi:MAG: GspE/PulE family protein [Candidatus Caenarcaniphilales bacterium]|jgi:type II secretory ATPase GspE/PulE/Tfp pilus assembly ATPase PilB-like protein|nr:GspE/PulE family protein [Candidatus Caenarcaniphilales bacterium]